MPRVTPKYRQEPFDRMLRRFRNSCEKAGIVKRVREKEFYVKRNQKKHKKNQEIARRKKLQAKRDALANSRYRGPLG